MTGATPVFVDVLPDTFNLDVESLKRAIVHAGESGLRPAGVIPVDLFGLPADDDAIAAIAHANGMWLVAESSPGFGARYTGQMTGSVAEIATTAIIPARPHGRDAPGGRAVTG